MVPTFANLQVYAPAREWADLVICRAGAMTVFELAAAGVASILVPYPHAVDDHQTKNAEVLVNAGAGILLHQTALLAQGLVPILSELLSQPQRLVQMAQACLALARADSRQVITQKIEKLVQG